MANVSLLDLKTFRSDNLLLCHPRAIGQFTAIRDELYAAYKAGLTRTNFGVFETYRNPWRQEFLKFQGVSQAAPYESAHQFGLAVDFVPYEYFKNKNKEWNWRDDNDYDFLKKVAQKHGCDVPIAWDLCHVEHPLWWHVKDEL